jgi:hypothetical protein
MSTMSPDELRQALAFADDDVAAPSVSELLALGRRARRRRRVVRTGVVAVTAAAVGAGPFVLLGGDGRTVTDAPADTPSAASTGPTGVGRTSATPAAPSATPTAATPEPAPTVRTAFAPQVLAPGERLNLGGGWAVWSKGKDVCTLEPHDAGVPASVPPNIDCRSTTDGNIGGLGFTGRSSRTERTYHFVFPGTAARVVVRFQDLVPREARLVRFTAVPGWTYYFVSVRGRFPLPNPDPQFDRKSVVAYDAAGRVISRFP